MAIHLVPEDAAELAELFGGETGDEVDKFDRCSGGPAPRARRSWMAARAASWTASSSAWTSGTTPAWSWSPSSRSSRSTKGQLKFHRAKRIEPGHEA